MSTKAPSEPINEESLTDAWIKAVERLCLPGTQEGIPLSVSFTEFDDSGFPVEDLDVRERLDHLLEEANAFSVETTANMIFPILNLRMLEARLGREASSTELKKYYLHHIYPKLNARNKLLNGKGTYFLRMIAYGIADLESKEGGINQIEQLIEIWNNNPQIKQSTLQIAVREPARDLNHDARRPFPCLQQVCIGYDKKGISVTGLYPIQSIFERAYGNYLGLAHLGWFIARAVGRRLVRVTCLTPHPQLSNSKGLKKTRLNDEFLCRR